MHVAKHTPENGLCKMLRNLWPWELQQLFWHLKQLCGPVQYSLCLTQKECGLHACITLCATSCIRSTNCLALSFMINFYILHHILALDLWSLLSENACNFWQSLQHLIAYYPHKFTYFFLYWHVLLISCLGHCVGLKIAWGLS